MSVVRSISTDQGEILDWILALHVPEGRFDCDATYGNGMFWRGRAEPVFKFDIDPQSDDVFPADSRDLPLPDAKARSVVFDPPFLTYVRAGRDGNGEMVMAKRFAGYWRYDELEEHYRSSIAEFRRVLAKDGVLVIKCQDIVHNHRLHATHVNVANWAAEVGFRLLDLFVLCAEHRLPSPNRAGKQKHARVFHSYFMVFKAT